MTDHLNMLKQKREAIDAAIKKEEARLTEIQGYGLEYELADLIHSSTCHLAHEDQCGWFYENWNNPGSTRLRYINKAKSLIKQFHDYDLYPNEVLEIVKSVLEAS